MIIGKRLLLGVFAVMFGCLCAVGQVKLDSVGRKADYVKAITERSMKIVDGLKIKDNNGLSCKSPWIGANQLPKDFGYPEHEERDILYTSYLRSEALHLRVQ